MSRKVCRYGPSCMNQVHLFCLSSFSRSLSLPLPFLQYLYLVHHSLTLHRSHPSLPFFRAKRSCFHLRAFYLLQPNCPFLHPTEWEMSGGDMGGQGGMGGMIGHPQGAGGGGGNMPMSMPMTMGGGGGGQMMSNPHNMSNSMHDQYNYDNSNDMNMGVNNSNNSNLNNQFNDGSMNPNLNSYDMNNGKIPSPAFFLPVLCYYYTAALPLLLPATKTTTTTTTNY